ncbi:hypothetical protein K501DRAFT_240829 [Backusella circina FSU 941]|nr:hypothetical protein K501DRAFT_240829 [Backusella circina FSU 941]
MSQYDLTVRVGSSIDTLQVMDINNDATPHLIDSDTFTGSLIVRVKGRGIPSPYFEHSQDTFCITVSGRFKHPSITADTILFGNQFDAPLRLPTGSSIAVKFAKWFDPGLEADLASERPFAFSPLVVTMNRLHLGVKPIKLSSAPIQEDITLIRPDITTAKQRQTYFTVPTNREQIQITPDQVWSMDFCNPYLDFEKCTVRIPGFEVNILRYWDGQPARFIAKSKEDGVIFFIVEFNLKEREQDNDID